jgi:rhodanese-related sulfurtransferase
MAAKAHNPGFELIVDSVRHGIVECTITEVRQRQDAHEPFHFIDVREDHEVAIDRAAGSVHLGRGIIERDIETVVTDKASPIVLYCGGGYRSALAADSLVKMGYVNVKSMAGGIRSWRDAGLPIETGTVRKL